MPGAARLAGEACLRVGAGLVTVAVAPENVAAISAGRPELICLAVVHEGELEEAIERANVVAIGPGLGRTEWARKALDAVLNSRKPLVVDADALNLVAEAGAREGLGEAVAQRVRARVLTTTLKVTRRTTL